MKLSKKMSSSEVRGRRVSGRQLKLLWEYLNSHRDIAVAFNRSLQAKEYSTRKWKEIANVLNAQRDGAHKDWRGWSKYWVDYKAKLKRRGAAIRSSLLKTGGPSTEQPLNDIECKFFQILGEDFSQGLPDGQVEPFLENTQIPEDSSILTTQGTANTEVLLGTCTDSEVNEPNRKPAKIINKDNPVHRTRPDPYERRIRQAVKKKFTNNRRNIQTQPEKQQNNLKSNEDEFHFFGLNVAAQLRMLPIHLALKMQGKIQDDLCAARIQGKVSRSSKLDNSDADVIENPLELSDNQLEDTILKEEDGDSSSWS